jgi:hypothetical protein
MDELSEELKKLKEKMTECEATPIAWTNDKISAAIMVLIGTIDVLDSMEKRIAQLEEDDKQRERDIRDVLRNLRSE